MPSSTIHLLCLIEKSHRGSPVDCKAEFSIPVPFVEPAEFDDIFVDSNIIIATGFSLTIM